MFAHFNAVSSDEKKTNPTSWDNFMNGLYGATAANSEGPLQKSVNKRNTYCKLNPVHMEKLHFDMGWLDKLTDKYYMPLLMDRDKHGVCTYKFETYTPTKRNEFSLSFKCLVEAPWITTSSLNEILYCLEKALYQAQATRDIDLMLNFQTFIIYFSSRREQRYLKHRHNPESTPMNKEIPVLSALSGGATVLKATIDEARKGGQNAKDEEVGKTTVQIPVIVDQETKRAKLVAQDHTDLVDLVKFNQAVRKYNRSISPGSRNKRIADELEEEVGASQSLRTKKTNESKNQSKAATRTGRTGKKADGSQYVQDASKLDKYS